MLSSAGKIALLFTCVSLGACAHEAKPVSAAPSAHYVLQSQRGVEAVTIPGFVSRYQRQTIVAGGADVSYSTPCAKNFDGIMDHLEGLMAPQIEENNRIAALQTSNPAFRF